MELSTQPSRSCPMPFFPGMFQVVVSVKRCRMSKSPSPYCAARFRGSWGDVVEGAVGHIVESVRVGIASDERQTCGNSAPLRSSATRCNSTGKDS